MSKDYTLLVVDLICSYVETYSQYVIRAKIAKKKNPCMGKKECVYKNPITFHAFGCPAIEESVTQERIKQDRKLNEAGKLLKLLQHS